MDVEVREKMMSRHKMARRGWTFVLCLLYICLLLTTDGNVASWGVFQKAGSTNCEPNPKLI